MSLIPWFCFWFIDRFICIIFYIPHTHDMGFPGGSDGKEFACNAWDLVLITGLGKSPGEGNGNPLQYSHLENSVDWGAWQATVHWVAKSQIWLSDGAHRYQKLHNTGSLNTLSQVGRCGSHIPRWRLGCRMLTREYSWDKHLWKRGRKCRVGQREKLSCDLIPMKASANLWETLEWD